MPPFDLNNSDWQHLIYLLVLLVFLLSSMTVRRSTEFGKVAKSAFLWLVILFGCIVIYSYRYELEGFKNRIFGEINPSSAYVSKQSETIAVNASEDGHFYVNLLMDEVKIRCMIDTGASKIAIDKSHLLRLGVDSDSLSYTATIYTANGTSRAARLQIKEIQIGEIQLENFSVLVSEGGINGTCLLGMDFLRRFRKYESYKDRFVLTY